MRDAYICSAARTPVGRHGGALAAVRPDDLGALVLKAAVERVGFDAARLDDVILGCANQAGEDNRNVARMAALLAGFPVEVPGQTVNRLCGSGLQAVASAAQAIKAEEGDAFLAGGIESMTRAPYVMQKQDAGWNRRPPEIADSTTGWHFVNPHMPTEWTISLGATAELVAKQYGITREEQDQFAYRSQQRAQAAMDEGMFDDELVSVPVTLKDGTVDYVTRDEHPRAGVTPERLARLQPAFVSEGGTVTAGSSSGINDGAAALLVLGGTTRGLGGTEPLARIVGTAVAGVDPSTMGIGPVPATRKVLQRTGLSINDIELVELNEAFAAQAIACIRELRLEPERVNIHGGAIALGHPLGCTGAKMLTTLVHSLERTGSRYGLATMCIGVGQGIAMVVERL
ncbi:MAG: acetyl-CoA C-acyltransferase [Gemmatimonadota bacterium]|nr:MAG: acetyl-CoA C-acyltransferase [Gemmatimonadota bacterium]